MPEPGSASYPARSSLPAFLLRLAALLAATVGVLALAAALLGSAPG